MAYENLLYERKGAAAWITLNRPDAMNSLSPGLVADLGRAVAQAEGESGLRAVVITGAGRAFCAGADLKFINGALAEGVGKEMTAFLTDFKATMDRVESCPLPVIAAVNGMALAGGLELLLCCDLVIAAEGARIGDAHANFGLIPGGGSSARLPLKIGPTHAKYLLYTGDFFPAAEFLHSGLVNRVVPDGELHAAVDGLVEKLAAKSPLSLGRMKALVNAGGDRTLEEALQAEIAAFHDHAKSRDMMEGLAAFNEKRSPAYTGT